MNGVTTTYVGNYYEMTGTANTKYYYANGVRTAEKRTGYTDQNGVYWLLSDHLGSTTITAYTAGGKKAELRYAPWGWTRYSSGNTLTSQRYTGQREEDALDLYWYNSRFYDPELARFTSPDTIVPEATQGTQAWDRFAYVNNNPVRYNDPSGHDTECGMGDPTCNIAGLRRSIQSGIRTYKRNSQSVQPSQSTYPMPDIGISPEPSRSPFFPAPTEYSPKIAVTPTPPPMCTQVPSTDPSSELGTIFDVVNATIDVLEYGRYINIPGPYGVALDIASQGIPDLRLDLSMEQRVGRIVIAVVEGQVVSVSTNFIGGAAGAAAIETGPGAAIAYSGVYILSNVLLSMGLEYFNEYYLFPQINLQPE